MELIESTEELIKQEKINKNEKEQEANYLDERVKKESRKLKKEYKTLKDVRDELIKEIPEESLRKYNHLRKSLGNFVLSKVKNGICLGCQVSLSSSLVGKLYTPGIEVTCENCGRLIFVDKD
ncbi:MAG: hypothetical protein CVU88_06615 [Firmicutes bacterium HGW-Firmicutes-13]|nr:MAG: hypothetical protein CVU88_06615 [Firmicutes bacterium HGW-Firmicutes-13]